MSDLEKQNREMRALLVRWNDAWKVAAIAISGHTNVDVALINAETELFLEATANEVHGSTGPVCEYCDKPATVFMPYTETDPDTFLCSECCKAKGLEDKCHPVADHPNNPDNEPPEEEQRKWEHLESGPVPGCDCHDCNR